ncbi:MAG: glycoside hydrolase family 127 protein [Anaerolineae bacterium]|nr:glycoside hydrolase family 127 protein [Anaerolineae bacterium]
MDTTLKLAHPLAVKDVSITGGFWADRQATNRNSTIPAIHHQMEITGRIDAWRLQWQPGQTKPHIFWDSDAGKWIEAAGYSLMTNPDPTLEKWVDALVDLIESAQQPDGYLNIFFTAVEPQNKWRNLRDWHELYDAGHLIEGAVAYAQATGKTKLLDVLRRYADHIDQRFGPNEGQRRGYCGHPEVELAMVKLYRQTGDQRYLNLAKYFIDERGREPHYFDLEANERGDDPAKFWAKTYRYCQAHVPIREQATAMGHSVRAGYLYSGVADVAAETGDDSLLKADQRFWDDLTQHQLYITGGLGPAHANEGFTFAYDLPNETAYAETCASISLVFWAQRMFQIDPDSRYIDVMERALYNNVLAGVSYKGDTFFYANPLASYPYVNPYEHFSGITSEKHYHRSEWFDCACCPPNLARMVASVGNYFYSTTDDTLFVHLYNQNRATFSFGGQSIQLDQTTNYPWDGQIKFTIHTDKPASFTLALRVPNWCSEYHLEVNGQAVESQPTRGYLHLERTWSEADQVTLMLAMPVERVVANPLVRQDAGCIALQRGPVVYCLEEVDNGAQLANIAIPRKNALTAVFEPDLFGGISVIAGQAMRVEPLKWPGGLYQPQSNFQYGQTPFTFKAIPYCFWANREPGEMRVWIREA